jgi:hypothetical protein
MNRLIVLLLVFASNVWADENGSSCQAECGGVTKSQKKCVIQKYCPEKRLRAEIEKLKAEKAALQEKYDRLVFDVHHMSKKEHENSDKNAINLIGAASQTKLETESTASTFQTITKYQPDVGLMYQHDFNYVRGSIGVTLNGTLMLGVGLTF